MYPDLEGKVVLLTGVGQMGDPSMWGNGAATAKVLACENKAKIFACDLNLEAAEHTKKRIEAEGGVCDVMAADVTDATQIKAFVEACMKKHGVYYLSQPPSSKRLAVSSY
jgi:NAD(P)-dependent dehydrogenase (short-subunit alcohol dehydrogenase family)